MSTTDRRLSVFLLVRSLDTGGAQRQIVDLACGLRQRGHTTHVGTFYRRGPLLADLERCNVPVVDLRKKSRWDVTGFALRARNAIRELRPDIVYSFLGGANLFATLLHAWRPKTKLVWSVRASDMDLNQYDWTRRLSYRAECLFSGIPDLIIANSFAGRSHAVSKGFVGKRMQVVPNGVDIERFRPDSQLRQRQRRQWELEPENLAIGVLARFDPMKGHGTFLKAAAVVLRDLPQARFICIGDGARIQKFQRMAAELGIADRVSFPGRTDDPVAALNGLDIYCSSSDYGEGFSNAIAEAMACSLPCVVTDVGDSARIVGDTGFVVPRANPAEMAKAILSEAHRSSGTLGTAARQRIIENYAVARMVDRTVGLLESILDGCPSGVIA